MASASRCPASIARRMPAKSNWLRSSSRSGELSNSERGGGSSQPPDIMASTQMHAGAQHRAGIGAEHLPDLEIAPDPLQIADSDPEPVGMHGNCGCVDGAGGGARHDGKGIRRSCGQQVGDCPQHADLIRRPCAPTRQDQPDLGGTGGWDSSSVLMKFYEA